MFERIDIRLTEPICEHPASPDNWSWSITQLTEAGMPPKFGLRVFCTKCDKSLEVQPKQLVALYKVTGKRQLQPTPTRDENPRHPPVSHERGFTPFDVRFLKAMKIKVEP